MRFQTQLLYSLKYTIWRNRMSQALPLMRYRSKNSFNQRFSWMWDKNKHSLKSPLCEPLKAQEMKSTLVPLFCATAHTIAASRSAVFTSVLELQLRVLHRTADLTQQMLSWSNTHPLLSAVCGHTLWRWRISFFMLECSACRNTSFTGRFTVTEDVGVCVASVWTNRLSNNPPTTKQYSSSCSLPVRTEWWTSNLVQICAHLCIFSPILPPYNEKNNLGSLWSYIFIWQPEPSTQQLYQMTPAPAKPIIWQLCPGYYCLVACSFSFIISH